MPSSAGYHQGEDVILNNLSSVEISYSLSSFRLQELSSSNEENPDLTDIELIQHINVDTIRLIKLLNGNGFQNCIEHFRLLQIPFAYCRNNIEKQIIEEVGTLGIDCLFGESHMELDGYVSERIH